MTFPYPVEPSLNLTLKRSKLAEDADNFYIGLLCVLFVFLDSY